MSDFRNQETRNMFLEREGMSGKPGLDTNKAHMCARVATAGAAAGAGERKVDYWGNALSLCLWFL